MGHVHYCSDLSRCSHTMIRWLPLVVTKHFILSLNFEGHFNLHCTKQLITTKSYNRHTSTQKFALRPIIDARESDGKRLNAFQRSNALIDLICVCSLEFAASPGARRLLVCCHFYNTLLHYMISIR